jgi:hypothetical protein
VNNSLAVTGATTTNGITNTGNFTQTGTTVLKGAEIGDHTVIGASSVVTGKITAGSIAAGNPARIVRQPAETIVIGEFGLKIGDGFDEWVPDQIIMAGARDLAVDVGQTRSEFDVGFLATCEADNVDTCGQFSIHGEIVQGRHKLAVSEITRGTEDDDRARLRLGTGNEIFAEGVHGKRDRRSLIVDGRLEAKGQTFGFSSASMI